MPFEYGEGNPGEKKSPVLRCLVFLEEVVAILKNSKSQSVPERGSPSASKSDLFRNLYVPEKPEKVDPLIDVVDDDDASFDETDVDEDEDGMPVELDE